jgi:hypothetical protein
VCSFCGIKGHTEPKCQKKKRAAQENKSAVKEHIRKNGNQIGFPIEIPIIRKVPTLLNLRFFLNVRNIRSSQNRRRKPLASAIGSSSIILKKFINKNVLEKNSRTTIEWTTLGEKIYTKKKGTVKFKLPEFFLNKKINLKYM